MAYFEDTSITHNVETVGAFRAWGAMIKKALEEVGLTRTEDTGQIDWTTVELPAISTYAGYEIWRFNDSEQATHPVYIRIDYGRAGAVTRPRLKMTVGSGTDGKGTVSGGESKEPTTTATISGSGMIYASLLEGTFTLIDSMLPASEVTTTGAGYMMFFVERLKKANYGAVDGLYFAAGAEGGSIRAGAVRYSGGWSNPSRTGPTGSEAGEYVSPGLVTVLGPILFAPLRCAAAVLPGIVGAGNTGKLLLHGIETTYMQLKTSNLIQMVGGASGATNVSNALLVQHE